MKTGVDISSCQDLAPTGPGSMKGFQALEEHGVDFVLMRAGGGGYKDPLFKEHWETVTQTTMSRGVTFYYHPGASVKANITNLVSFHDQIQAAELDYAIDVEIAGANLQKDLSLFIKDAVRETQKSPIMYSGAWFWDAQLKPEPWMAGLRYWLGTYPYAKGRIELTFEEFRAKWQPNLQFWPKAVKGGVKPAIWQFSGDKFIFPDIGLIDLNLLDDTLMPFISRKVPAPETTLVTAFTEIETKASELQSLLTAFRNKLGAV